MGILVDQTCGRRVSLRSRHLIGRSRRNDLRLRDSSVSGEHAALVWRDDKWWIRDLGSRNGTFADGMQVGTGDPRGLAEGASLSFGDVSGWVIEDARGPEARAIALDGGADAVAVAGVLALPSATDPQIVLSERKDGAWVAQGDASDRIVIDLDEIEVGGRRFRLHLPMSLESTTIGAARVLRIPDVELRFYVSRDEETVEIEIRNGTASHRLHARAHNYTLATLARIRMRDAALPEAEQGWVEREVLCDLLKQARPLLNVQMYRLRLQLAEAGVLGVEGLFERRPGKLRVGVAELSEHPLEL
ncbi:MAG: FHA domain-containing protein [Deltaproteobacteria bacterium]|nr:MAG: FHA domain-containing protein [Deltaproteobacteria bacterium]